MNRKIISVFSGLSILLIAYFISSLIINNEEETLNNNTNITHLVNAIKIKNQSNPISAKVNGNSAITPPPVGAIPTVVLIGKLISPVQAL